MKLTKKSKLPKQLRHWFKAANLKWKSSSSRDIRGRFSVSFTLIGQGYLWRIDCYNTLNRNCKIEDFDRWANSNDYQLDLVSNREEFVKNVTYLTLLKERTTSGVY